MTKETVIDILNSSDKDKQLVNEAIAFVVKVCTKVDIYESWLNAHHDAHWDEDDLK